MLLPLSGLFALLIALRRALFRAGLFRAHRLPVPVIVVGNLTVGGSGKTPLVLWLAARLLAQGHRPGIISRGYGGTAAGPRAVAPGDDPAIVGDEPALLAARAGVPVWIGADRAAAAAALLAAHPACDILVSDDGLQHYALARDFEIAVVDGARGFGNGWLLPAGPLREPLSRLTGVDAVVVNGTGTPDGVPAGALHLRLEGGTLRNLREPARSAPAAGFAGRPVHAMAGIGDPERFFRHLEALGLTIVRHPFPDHHAYTAADLEVPATDLIVMTEKDAVKCAAFATERCWALPVEARVDEALAARLVQLFAPRRPR
ncbi:MAG: tetraacyldisaccharide 4'-kinase [Burkholderiales bacterium]